MIFKILGAVLIISGTSFYGYSKAMLPYKRYKNLVKIYSGLSIIENEIRYKSDYIDTVLKKAAEITEFDSIFKTASHNQHCLPISTRWKNAVAADSPALFFTKEDSEIISMLGNELGMTDREGQLKNIEHIKKMLAASCDSAKSEYEKQSRLFKGLGVAFGLFAVIIFL